MLTLDIFNDNAFGVTSLTQSINKLPLKPSRIGQMGLFKGEGVQTTSVIVEERNGILSLLTKKLRGEQGTTNKHEKRIVRSFAIPHIPQSDTILADEVQGVRAFGSATELETVAQKVNDRLQSMKNNHELTEEYHRIGALQGVILDGDGSTTIYNLFTEFGITQKTVNFALGTPTTKVRNKCTEVIRAIEAGLGGLAMYDHIHAFCGSTWFDAFVEHPAVKDAFHRYNDSEMLRSDVRKGFTFGNITFEEYSGSVGSVAFFPANEARFFPVGVPGMFTTYYAPANYIETVNTIGQPYYAKQEIMKFGKGVELETQSNPLCMCTMPRALIKGTNS